jgi:hypothetical protein
MKLALYLELINENFDSTQYKDYMGGAVAAIRAITKGEDIGIVTARANKEGHEPLLQAIENQLSLEIGKKINIDRDKIDFINDKKFISKINSPNSNQFQRKALVILSYIMDDKYQYDKIKFYDDDNRNLEAVRSEIANKKNELKQQIDNLLLSLKQDKSNKHLKQELLKNIKILKRFKNISLKVYDIKQFDNKKLNKLPNNSSKVINQKKVLHLFDVDDTLVIVPSKIHVKVGEKRIKSLSPGELPTYTLNKDEELDYTDFIDNDEIARTVKELKNTTTNIFKPKH